MRNWKLAAIPAVLMMALPFMAYGADGQSPPAKKAQSVKAAKPAAAAAVRNPCPNPPPCDSGHNCSNYPFKPTDCWTTKYGPARADVIIPNPGTKTAVTSPNMLYCEGNPYALCFFSGPPTVTGNPNVSGKNALPCVLNGDVANCTCQAYTSGPNFVDINGILNRGAYFETVKLCGQDGSRCKNITNCWPAKDPKKQKECQGYPEAPVCKYIKNQSPSNPQGSLMPKADLISTFSFAMSEPVKEPPYQLGSTPCTSKTPHAYAGCMTAPCFRKPGQTGPVTDRELVQCECPTFTGVFQVGQNGQTCQIPDSDGKSYVWSASNTVTGGGGK
jgi:hypothetical protein